MLTALWNDPSRWPLETLDQVFLIKAADMVGRQMFGSQWERGPVQIESAASAIRNLCAFRRLVASFYLDGRGFIPVRVDHWNARGRFLRWFETGKLSDDDAYGTLGASRYPRHWVFVDREALSKLFAEGEFLGTAASSVAIVGSVNRQAVKADRTLKTAYSLDKVLMPWAKGVFAGEKLTRKEFEAQARAKWNDVSIPQLRKDVWPKRPASWPRRTKKGG